MNPDPDEHVHPGEEELEWGEGISVKKREKKPQSKYWAISEQARKMFPGERQCKMFCGGKHCKYCTPDIWTQKEMVVDGLYSNWVTDNILAMARMSDANIDKFKFLEQFEKLGVRTVINLQEPGEHAHCGSGNGPGGFSYDPQRLMASKFFFYNFVMKDYGVAPMSTLLDTVKVMQFAVSVGKVAVHCHAGLGRTGLIIACYLIYNNRVSARKAIQYVRSRRPGSIQTKQQVTTCHDFEIYLKVYFVVFTSKAPDTHPVSFSRFLVRQRQLLHGYEARKLKHIPKIVYVCCERLLELCGRGIALSSLREMRVDPLPEDLVSIPDMRTPRPDASCLEEPHRSLRQSHSLSVLGNDKQNKGRAHTFTDSLTADGELGKFRSPGIKESLSASRINDLKYGEKEGEEGKGKNLLSVSRASSKKLRSLDVSPVNKQKLTKTKSSGSSEIEQTQRMKQKNSLHERSKNRMFGYNGHNESDEENGDDDDGSLDEDDNDSIVYGQTEEELEDAKRQAAKEVLKAEEAEVRIYNKRSSQPSIMQQSVLLTAQEVCEAASDVDFPQVVLDKIEDYKDKLNKSHQAWQALATEEDPAVICRLMTSWLDHLNEPVLRFQDINSMIANHGDVERALLGLETSTKYFLEYIVVVLSKLCQGVSPQCLHALLELLLTDLCQRRLCLGYITWPDSESDVLRGEHKPEYAEQLFRLFHNLILSERRKQVDS